jgi:hypothetical protein
MKTLVGVAVFGLVPVPPMPDTVSSGFDGRWTTSEHDLDLSQLVFFPHPVAERMATKDELARIRYELEEIAAKTSTKGPRHSRAGAPGGFDAAARSGQALYTVTRGTRSCANFCVRGKYVAVPSRICSQKRHPDGAMPASIPARPDGAPPWHSAWRGGGGGSIASSSGARLNFAQ